MNSFGENVENSLLTTDIDGNHLGEEGVSYEVGDNDLNAFSKFEITPTMVNEIEWNIAKLKMLKVEATEITGTKIKNEFGQCDEPSEIRIPKSTSKFNI